MNFKVGDDVCIREDIREMEHSGLTLEMKRYAGIHAKIIRIYTTMNGINHYYLKIDGHDGMSSYWWLAEWLESICNFDLKDECEESFSAFLAE